MPFEGAQGAGYRKCCFECDVCGTSQHRVVGLQPSSGFLQRGTLQPRGHQGALQVIVTPIEPSRENRCEGFFCPDVLFVSQQDVDNQ